MRKIGLPRMHAIHGFRRDYVPSFVNKLAQLPDIEVCVEEGYGQDLNYRETDYTASVATGNDIFRNADLVLTLTAPTDDDIKLMTQGQTLVSMLHFPTHPDRN